MDTVELSALRAWQARSAWLLIQLIQQSLGVLQVGSVEALGEPVVDFGELRARLIAAIGVAQQPSEAGGGAKLPPLRRLASRDFDSLAKTLLRLGRRRGIARQD